MKKQIIYSQSNEEKYLCYQLGKEKDFFSFLFKLLDILKIEQPDLFDENGELPDINSKEYVDTFDDYNNQNCEVQIFYGCERIFLIVRTEKYKTDLTKFMIDNCEFYKYKN